MIALELASHLLAEYTRDNVADMHHDTFEQEMIDQVQALIAETTGEDHPDAVHQALDLLRFHTPCRVGNFAWPQPDIEDVLAELDKQAPMAQRTKEWYDVRHNIITASAAHKLFGSPAKFNELVYEKCTDVVEHAPCTSGPRHWGVKYEPLSIMYYEHTCGAKVQEYGCIIHPKYPFLGASPDGINVAKDSPRYGRMLEIKNPVSRELSNTPKEEYWIQTQLQMEVCNIDACDFLETKFIEYSEAEFDADGTFTNSAQGDPKGIIVLMCVGGANVYKYPPFGCSREEFTEWEAQLEGEWVLSHYWKLVDVECTLIQRNTEWFKWALPTLQKAWDTILTERASGEFVHRAPKKKGQGAEECLMK